MLSTCTMYTVVLDTIHSTITMLWWYGVAVNRHDIITPSNTSDSRSAHIMTPAVVMYCYLSITVKHYGTYISVVTLMHTTVYDTLRLLVYITVRKHWMNVLTTSLTCVSTHGQYLRTVHALLVQCTSTYTTAALAVHAGMYCKIPCYPLHAWLTEAHVESSTEGSIVLAGVYLKVGSTHTIQHINSTNCFVHMSVHYTVVYIHG